MKKKEKKYKIGVIDDLIDEIALELYNISNKKTELKKVELVNNLNDLMEQIREEKYDGLIIDQKLSAKAPGINYKGTDISKELDKNLRRPYVFWTSDKDSVRNVCKSNEVEMIYGHEKFGQDEAFVDSGANSDKNMLGILLLKIEKLNKEIENKKIEMKALKDKAKITTLTTTEKIKLNNLDNEICSFYFEESSLEKELKNIDFDKINEILDKLEEEFGN